jgi:hypothetical protein
VSLTAEVHLQEETAKIASTSNQVYDERAAKFAAAEKKKKKKKKKGEEFNLLLR